VLQSTRQRSELAKLRLVHPIDSTAGRSTPDRGAAGQALYQQLAVKRAGRARATLAEQVSVGRLSADSASALEDAAGVLRWRGVFKP
jgi:hypothetical protein